MKRRASADTVSGRPTKKYKKSARAPTSGKKTYSVLLAPELKFNDVTINTDANTTSTEIALTTFAAGDTALQRDGNKAVIKSVEFRLRLTNSALTQSNVVRFALVVDKLAQGEQCIWGAGAAVQDVFDAATVVARRNVISAARFIVLKEVVVVLNDQAGTGGGPAQCYIHEFVKVPKDFQLAAWASGSATIPVTNALTLMYLGSTAAGVTDVNVEGTARVRFMG